MATKTATVATAIDLERLRNSIHGLVIGPDDEGYDEARSIWNGAIDRRPAGIARCTGVADVVAAVRFARERELLVAVRSGGHGVGGHALCDGGLVIDLSPMKAIRVDPAARTARAEAGVLWGELDRETQLHGLATVGGIVTHTGIAGLTLGGGIGWLMRKYGATVDNLLSADVVTAEGEVVKASEEENPELFWGIRGGGGNFGIVTSFEYRLHPVGPNRARGTDLPPARGRPRGAAVLPRVHRRCARRADDDLQPACCAPAPVPAGGRTRQADRDGRRLLRGIPRGRRRGCPPAQAVRPPDRRPARAEALHGPAVDVRPVRAAWLALLLEVASSCRR